MSYKVKSLLYFAAFMASVFIHTTLDFEKAQETVEKPVQLTDDVTDNADLDSGTETALLGNAQFNN